MPQSCFEFWAWAMHFALLMCLQLVHRLHYDVTWMMHQQQHGFPEALLLLLIRLMLSEPVKNTMHVSVYHHLSRWRADITQHNLKQILASDAKTQGIKLPSA